MPPDRLVRDVLRDVEGVDVKLAEWFNWSRSAEAIGQAYDEACREGMTKLWEYVADDGCVMANPLRGQLEGVGWVVYVQRGNKDQEFRGDMLLQAINIALEELDLV